LTERSLGQRFVDSFKIRPQLPAAEPEPGIYHYERLEADWPTRFHLRVDPDGQGLLLANAAQAAVLSESGVLMAQAILEGREDHDIFLKVGNTFPDVTGNEIWAGLAQVRTLIENLSHPGDNYPISDLDDPYAATRSRAFAAPLRADVVPGQLELTEEIIRKLWDAGIPHVALLVRPELHKDDLPRLVEAAEDIGMIAGLRTVASWLPEEVLEAAANAGLDHLTLLYASAASAEHDALVGAGDNDLVWRYFARCEELELCAVAQVPLMQSNVDEIETIIGQLGERGVTNISFFALACPDNDELAREAGALPGSALPQVATVINEASETANVRYLWEVPVRFDNSRSLAEQVTAGPRAAGDVAIRVDQDGTVYPARGPRTSAGNILGDTWEQIWENPCFTRYRERLAAPTRCADCPDLPICAADCPRDPRGWSDDTQGGEG